MARTEPQRMRHSLPSARWPSAEEASCSLCRCEFTNNCQGLDQRHKQVTCKLWDRVVDSDDMTVSRASDGRRRLSAPPWGPPDP